MHIDFGPLRSDAESKRAVTASRASSPVVVVLSLLELVDVPPLQQQLLFLHDQQGPTDASGVRVDPDLSLSDVPDHRHLGTHAHTHTSSVSMQSHYSN